MSPNAEVDPLGLGSASDGSEGVSWLELSRGSSKSGAKGT